MLDQRGAGWMLIGGGAAGFVAAVLLTVERTRMLALPGYLPLCDVNERLTCGAVLTSWQAEALGFPNTYLGLAGFPLVTAVGVLALGNVRMPRWFVLTHLGGVIAASIFVLWLVYQSVAVIRVLCPYCLVVWAVTPLVLIAAIRLAVSATSRQTA
ncbi:vitamin K epoxide reductase family protein [Hoyosella subflava]|nr:vitamin K epoxide reductase family protein [Hoyosella subflava]